MKQLDPTIFTKSGLMVGLGESRTEIMQVMDDLRIADVDFLTIGQYLQPTIKHAAVDRFVTPDEFADYAALARGKGFLLVSATPADPQLLPRRRRFRRAAHAARQATAADRRRRATLPDADPRAKQQNRLPTRRDNCSISSPTSAKYPAIPALVRRRARAQPRTDDELIADLTIGFGPFRESFTSRVTLDRPHRVKVRYENGPFRYLNNQWDVPAASRRAPRWISSSISNSAAASCRPPSASCSTRRCAAWSPPSTSGPARSTVRPTVPAAATCTGADPPCCTTPYTRPARIDPALPPVRVNLYSDTQTKPSPP